MKVLVRPIKDVLIVVVALIRLTKIGLLGFVILWWMGFDLRNIASTIVTRCADGYEIGKQVCRIIILGYEAGNEAYEAFLVEAGLIPRPSPHPENETLVSQRSPARGEGKPITVNVQLDRAARDSAKPEFKIELKPTLSPEPTIKPTSGEMQKPDC